MTLLLDLAKRYCHAPLVAALFISLTFTQALAAPSWQGAELLETDNTGAAQSPQTAFNTNGQGVVTWQQSDGTRTNIWANYYTPASGWSGATLIETNNVGAAYYPAAAIASDGEAFVVWQHQNGARYDIWGAQYVPGTGWSAPALLETDSTYIAARPHVAVDGAGTAVAVWRQSDGTRYYTMLAVHVKGESAWRAPVKAENVTTGDANLPRVATSARGDIAIVWLKSDGTRDNVWAVNYVSGSGWTSAVGIETQNMGHAYAPQVAVDNNGNAVAVWHQSNGTILNVWSNRFTPGAGWGTPQLLDTTDTADSQNPRVAVNSAGYAVAAWSQKDSGQANIYARIYTPGTGWSAAALAEQITTGDADYPAVGIDSSQNAAVAWSQAGAGAITSIYTNKYVPATGWGTPQLLETSDTGSAALPSVAMNASGEALAAWQQSDGTRTNIWANRYITPQYRLTVLRNEGGSVAADTGVLSCGATCEEWYPSGTAVTLTATPSAGYRLAGWTGCPSVSGNQCAVTMTANVTVTATFEISSYTVTGSAGANGAISPASRTVTHGNITTFTVTPNTGYTASVTGCGGFLSGTAYTTGPVTANCTVSATFTVNGYTVTPSAGANGSISPATPQLINYGATASFTVTPNAGFYAVVTGCGGTLAGNTYTTGAITGDCAVTASFSMASYTVTPSAGPHGTISPATPQVAPFGAQVSFTVSADPTYSASVTGCGGALNGSTYTTAPLTGDCAVNAVFAIHSVTVSISDARAIELGARWRVKGESAWRASGETAITDGSAIVEFNNITGYDTPADVTVGEGAVVVAGAQATYMPSAEPSADAPGEGQAPVDRALTVNLTPTGAVAAGARWYVNDEFKITQRQTGDSVPLSSPYSYHVIFEEVPPYRTPLPITGTASSGSVTLTVKYGTPPLDFNGDGKSDVYFRHQSGPLYVWNMSGNRTTFGGYVSANPGDPATVNEPGNVAGKGDFNGDGITDLLFETANQPNGATRNLTLWMLDNVNVARTSVITAASFARAANEIVGGVGDFNGDGYDDILMLDTASASGDLVPRVLFISDGALASAVAVTKADGSPLTITTSGDYAAARYATHAGWHVADVCDYDADGRADILWRFANQTTVNSVWLPGQASIWYMSGASRVNGASLPASLGAYTNTAGGATPTGWLIQGSGDFNKDGYCDLILQYAGPEGGSVQVGYLGLWTLQGKDANGAPQFYMPDKGPVVNETGTELMNSGAFSATAGWNLIVGLGDYNGDGYSDLLFRYMGTGHMYVWPMKGRYVQTSSPDMGFIDTFPGDVNTWKHGILRSVPETQ